MILTVQPISGQGRGKPPPTRAAGSANPIYRVPVGKAPTVGPASALVTVVIYGGLPCRYTRKALKTLRAIQRARPKEIRLVFKHYPLLGQAHAMAAAEAAVEAQRQGRFWRFLDRLAAGGWKLAPPALSRAGRAAGLKRGSIAAALKARRHRKAVQADRAQGVKVRVRGTPTLFINGARLTGAKPAASYRKAIARARARARKELRRKGVTRKNLYARLIAKGIAPGRPRAARPRVARPRAARRTPSRIPRVIRGGVARTVRSSRTGATSLDLRGVPALGPEGALVTVLLFTNFRCSYGNYIWDAFSGMQREHPGLFRLYLLQHRISRHNRRARVAAEAALAAQAQGRFWGLAEILFHNRHGISAKRLEQHAIELGLNLKAYRAAMAKGTHRKRVWQQVARSKRFLEGKTRCPVVWINGRLLEGYISKWKLRNALSRAAREVRGIQARPLP
jgi:protein-disulfide isomerase